MNNLIWLFTDDPDLQSLVEQELELEAELRTFGISTLTGDLPERSGSVLMLLDLRGELAEECVPGLFQNLDFAARHPQAVVTITNRGYRREWGQLADRVVAANLMYPITPCAVREVWQQYRGGLFVARPEHTAGSRTLSSPELKLTTHYPPLFPVLEQLGRVAEHDVTLLFVGETGTGKTTLAQLVHQLSSRRNERFMNVACGALPMDLIESELFGHVRGAFTGADRAKVGRFEAAERGTLLLDEIDILGPKEQTKLLRVIETGEYELVGSSETRHSAARLIVASNVDLKGLVAKNQFRADLYFRLNVLEFHLPALRERTVDIIPLALDFIEECCQQHNIKLDRIHPDFLTVLHQYPWPGNIRELKNQMRRAVLFARNGELSPADLSLGVTAAALGVAAEAGASRVVGPWRLSEKVARSEREMLEEALRAHGNHRAATAKSLGISRVGLYKKMRKYGLLLPRRKRTGQDAGLEPLGAGQGAS